MKVVSFWRARTASKVAVGHRPLALSFGPVESNDVRRQGKSVRRICWILLAFQVSVQICRLRHALCISTPADDSRGFVINTSMSCDRKKTAACQPPRTAAEAHETGANLDWGGFGQLLGPSSISHRLYTAVLHCVWSVSRRVGTLPATRRIRRNRKRSLSGGFRTACR